MNHSIIAAATKCISFTVLLAGICLFSAAQSATPADANASIGMLSGQKVGIQAKLAAVKDEIETFNVTVRDPHNLDAAEEKRQVQALEAEGLDVTSPAYIQRAAVLDAWDKRIEERRNRELPKLIEMKNRETEYTQNIADIDTKIKDLIRKYSPDCADNESMEAAVNCWAMYFDGEEKRNALPSAVPLGTRFFSNGVPAADADAFKTYRNEQLDKINSGINKTKVPDPPPPPPEGVLKKAADDVIHYMQDLMKGVDKYRTRRTTAVNAVRG